MPPPPPPRRVPASLVEQMRGALGPDTARLARALASGETVAATPRDASTVVLLRDAAAGGVEAYLLRRQRTMAFAAGMYVFPGGSVDPRDASLDPSAWAGPAPQQWAEILRADVPLATALVCAAVRETFEESGVLLAGTGDDDVVDDTTGEDWEADRVALIDRTLSLAELLRRRGLVLRADLLRAWAHWITPEIEPRRFDTRFFVAALPAGQRTRDVGGEADRVTWVSPAAALDAVERGEFGMLPPTAFTLAELTAYDDVAAVLEAGHDRDIQPVLPTVTLHGDDARLLLPHLDGPDQA